MGNTNYTIKINLNRSDDSCESPLKHLLPMVSQYFRELLQSQQADYLWKESLVRRMEDEPFIWKNGMLSMIAKWDGNVITTAKSLDDEDDAEVILNAATSSYRN